MNYILDISCTGRSQRDLAIGKSIISLPRAAKPQGGFHIFKKIVKSKISLVRTMSFWQGKNLFGGSSETLDGTFVISFFIFLKASLRLRLDWNLDYSISIKKDLCLSSASPGKSSSELG